MQNEKIVGMESIIDLIWTPEEEGIADISNTSEGTIGHPAGGGGSGGSGPVHHMPWVTNVFVSQCV